MPPAPNLVALTATIVAAHLTKTHVPAADLPGLIEGVFQALAGAGETTAPVAAQEPAVPVRRSVFPEHIVCLEDGKKFSTLKRHLRIDHGMTPQDYRRKWALPDSYPMVAPNYASYRSDLAKKAGLGRKPAPPTTAEVPVQKIKVGVSGRRPGRKKTGPAEVEAGE